MEGCLYNVGRLHWLRVAPQVRPRVYTSWLREFFPSIPTSIASPTYHPCSDIPICARDTTNLQRRRCLGSNSSSSWSLMVSSSSSSEPGERVKEEEEEENEEEEEENVARDVNNGKEGEQDHRTWKFEPRAFNPKTKAPPAAVDLLALTERELLSQCKMETFRASGPGGQHRNKTDSGVRLRHLPTGLVSQGTEDRSQQNNRVQALRRLRQLIAIEVRRPVELEGYSPPPELMRILPSSAKSGKKREGGQQIGPNHDDYVLGMQQLLDLLWTVKGSISECAASLGLSTGVLSRLIVSDKKLWNAVNSLRATHNLKPLRGDN